MQEFGLLMAPWRQLLVNTKDLFLHWSGTKGEITFWVQGYVYLPNLSNHSYITSWLHPCHFSDDYTCLVPGCYEKKKYVSPMLQALLTLKLDKMSTNIYVLCRWIRQQLFGMHQLGNAPSNSPSIWPQPLMWIGRPTHHLHHAPLINAFMFASCMLTNQSRAFKDTL